ncbi:hypothetical protein [Pseudorhizobium pelagicum]|uniref:hypothetical protein n=1 Tax=Pseudorhizobium pelagicum TaxID=1509405 RepID=UPI003460AB6F
MKPIMIAGLCLFGLHFGIARADPMKTDEAIFTLMFQETREQTGLPTERRKQLADSLVAFWRDFDSKVPRNSPSVAEWLNKELDTTDMGRISRVTSTPEYALRELDQLANACLSDAELVQNSIGNKPLFEMYAWLRLAGCYGNPLGTEQHLKAASLSTGLYDGPLTMAHATAVHSFITGRVGNAIVSQEQ